MMTFKTAFVSLAFAGLAIGHGAVPARAGDKSTLRVKPLAVVDLTIGTKRAIGYYTAGNGACNTTLLLSDIDYAETLSVANSARISTVIGAGTSSRVDTEWGPSLVMTCEPGASAMSVQSVDRVAYTKSQTQQH